MLNLLPAKNNLPPKTAAKYFNKHKKSQTKCLVKTIKTNSLIQV